MFMQMGVELGWVCHWCTGTHPESRWAGRVALTLLLGPLAFPQNGPFTLSLAGGAGGL